MKMQYFHCVLCTDSFKATQRELIHNFYGSAISAKKKAPAVNTSCVPDSDRILSAYSHFYMKPVYIGYLINFKGCTKNMTILPDVSCVYSNKFT